MARSPTIAAYVLIRLPHQRFWYFECFPLCQSVILLRVVLCTTNVIPAPSLQVHYRLFNTTTSRSVPISRCVQKTGSHVPYYGLIQILAALTTGAAQSVVRCPLCSSGPGYTNPFLHRPRFRCFIGQFTFVQLSG